VDVEAELTVEGVERSELVAELQLELRGVDALGLLDEQTPVEQRQLELQVLVGEPKIASRSVVS
jgi:hypothetical protein